MKAVEDMPTVYLFVGRKSEATLCSEFIPVIGQSLDVFVPMEIRTFRSLFQYLMELSSQKPFNLVIDEFQELGFSVAWRFPEGTSEEQIDQTVNDLIEEVIEPNKLAFDGSGYLSWEGLICMQEIGKCTEEHQAIVRKWLEARKLEDVRTSELFDVWWD